MIVVASIDGTLQEVGTPGGFLLTGSRDTAKHFEAKYHQQGVATPCWAKTMSINAYFHVMVDK